MENRCLGSLLTLIAEPIVIFKGEARTTLEQEYREYEEAGRIWGLVPQERIKRSSLKESPRKLFSVTLP